MTESDLKRKFRQLERSGKKPTLIHAQVMGNKVVCGEIRSDSGTLFSWPRGFKARFEDPEAVGKGWSNPFQSSYGLMRASEYGFVA